MLITLFDLLLAFSLILLTSARVDVASQLIWQQPYGISAVDENNRCNCRQIRRALCVCHHLVAPPFVAGVFALEMSHKRL